MNRELSPQEIQYAITLKKQGKLLLDEKDYEKAVNCFVTLSQYYPSSTSLLLIIGSCYQKMGLVIQALSYYLMAKYTQTHQEAVEKKLLELSTEVGEIIYFFSHQAIDVTWMENTHDEELVQIQSKLHAYRTNASYETLRRLEHLIFHVPGYGTIKQFLFFNAIISIYKPTTILLIGVYRGRDCSFILDAAKTYNIEVDFTGVDKFSDDSCADWPEEDRNKNWEDAGFGVAPDIEETKRNLLSVGFSDVHLIQMDDEEFLSQNNNTYDFIYIDTAHDYETVQRQIHQVKRLCHNKTIIAGDDYSDEGGWGVAKAVRDETSGHGLFLNWIWYTLGKNL